MEQFHILTPEREEKLRWEFDEIGRISAWAIVPVVYDRHRLITSSVDANYNAYATLKLSYTFEYGKKVGRSPKYQTGRGESTIIEGRY